MSIMSKIVNNAGDPWLWKQWWVDPNDWRTARPWWEIDRQTIQPYDNTFEFKTITWDSPAVMMPDTPVEKETEMDYSLSFAMPGVSKDDITVELEGRTLTVRLETNVEEENSTFCSSFEFSKVLPDDADLNQIGTRLKDGILKIVVGKVEKVEPQVKKLEIE